jgi:hypothetical protein
MLLSKVAKEKALQAQSQQQSVVSNFLAACRASSVLFSSCPRYYFC